MSGQSRSVYASAPFKFIVEGEPLYIPIDLVSLHSKPLDRMMNGHMAEAKQGFATLKDVDKDTFVRFIEWAHRGYYTAAEPTTVGGDGSDNADLRTEDESVAEKPVQRTNIPAEEEDSQAATLDYDIHVEPVLPDGGRWGGGSWNVGPKKVKLRKTPRTAKEQIRHSFISRQPLERKNVIEVAPPRGNKSPAEVYSDVFLSHARLCVFAEKYDIQALKMLALDELYAILAIYTLYANRTSDIIDLLRYIYCNDEPSVAVEDLRILTRQYIGCEMDILTDDKDFKELMMEDEGALLSDFMTMVGKRISDDKALRQL